MVRLVELEAKEPAEIKVGEESKFVCQCGLSKNMPLCDGSHKQTADEEEGKVYYYDGTVRHIVQQEHDHHHDHDHDDGGCVCGKEDGCCGNHH